MTRDDPERAHALSYAPARKRPALAALLDLDATLGQILRTTREPQGGQMRLTWWHDALVALDHGPPPAEPVLRALAAEVLPRGVTGALLARIVEGWEALLEDEVTGDALARHAILRGATLFEAGTMILAVRRDRRIERLGRGWAYADVGIHLRNKPLAELAKDRALLRLILFRPSPIEKAARALGALALIARMNLSSEQLAGSPRRVARLAWHRLTGRGFRR